MATMNYKCPNCDGPLKFNPDKQKFTCEYCLSEFAPEAVQEMNAKKEQRESYDEREVKRAEREKQQAKEKGEEADDYPVYYTCPSCGAEVVTTSTTAATTCFYCYNPVVLGGRLSDEFKPDRVIPFELSKEKAQERFLAMCGKKWFLPKGFAGKEQFEKLNGVYFPYWFADEQKAAHLTATGKKIRTWRSGNKEYTETRIFHVVRGGNVIINNVFERALKSESRDMLQSVHPYDMKAAKPFAMSYLSGFQAEKRDLEKKDVEPIIEQKMHEYAEQVLKNTAEGYDVIETESFNERTDLAAYTYNLLPVWMVTYKYKDEIIPFAINGQTGKAYGQLPVAAGKLALGAIIVALLVFVLGTLGGMLFL